MLSAEQLRKGWEERALLFPIEPALTFAEAGGSSSGLELFWRRAAPIVTAARHSRSTVAKRASWRCWRSLNGRSVAPETIGHIRRACRHYADGKTSLALIQLAYASPPRSDDPGKVAYRLFLADALLADRVPAHDLLAAFDIDPTLLDRTGKRFNVNEPPSMPATGAKAANGPTSTAQTWFRPPPGKHPTNTGPEIPTNSSIPCTHRFTPSPKGSASTRLGSSVSPRLKAVISTRTTASSTTRLASPTAAA